MLLRFGMNKNCTFPNLIVYASDPEHYLPFSVSNGWMELSKRNVDSYFVSRCVIITYIVPLIAIIAIEHCSSIDVVNNQIPSLGMKSI